MPICCGDLQALEKGWVGNGTGRQIGDLDDEEDATPRTDLKKNSPAQRSALPSPCILCTPCRTEEDHSPAATKHYCCC